MKGSKFVIYQDSLQVHKSNISKEYMREAGIECIYAPFYSPDYNAIEFIFSKLKGSVKR